MAQHYSDPKRETDPHALHDIEVFWADEGELEEWGDNDEPSPKGWYWWSCFPGCLPDGAPEGPFDSEEEALADARDGLED